MDATTAFLGNVDANRVEIVVNFGLVSGREATLAEVDRLARRLLGYADAVTITACRRHEVTHENETIVHQVHVEVDAAPRFADLLRDRCETWALDCAADRSVEPIGL